MRTVRPTSSAPHRKKVQRATAALGLLCALTAGSCWAQQTAAQTAPAAEAKPAVAAKGKSNAKAHAKKANSAQTKQGSDHKSAGKASGDKSGETTARDDKAEAKLAESKLVDKADAKVEAKADAKRADSRSSPTKLSDASPPAGTMMGAYGQSLMRTASVAAGLTTGNAVVPAGGTTLTAQAGHLGAAPALVSVASAQATTVTAPSISAVSTVVNTATAPAAPALPATAMMGAAGVSSSDTVTKFLQQRGIVAQAQAQTLAEDAAIAGNPSLLNEVRDRASNLVMSAMNFLGVPYRRGGNSVSNGFDCSGFTRHIFEMSVGLVLPRRADEQAKMSALVSIKKEDLKPGDLVFFNTMRATFSHVGIYVGEGKFIHSPRAGGAVRVEDMREAYWAKRFTGARRADLTQAPNT